MLVPIEPVLPRRTTFFIQRLEWRSGGVFALLYVLARKFKESGVSRSIAAEIASYYWHFMDGLWIFLLALLYLGK